MPLSPDPHMDGAHMAHRLVRLLADPRVQARLRTQIRHISRRHTVPGISGSSLDGMTIHIDRGLPAQLLVGTSMVPVLGQLVRHERVARALMDALSMDPAEAGQFATAHTQHRVLAAGVAWPRWAEAVARYLRDPGSLDEPPPDLDLRPWQWDSLVHDRLAASQASARGAIPASRRSAA